ncbi:MAG TPA: alkaline phosphatase family protein, partial [Candidatus Dormibacteraeota bacterium]|nr:alkaline phosphatase family protein [Candidatus Dormibacteraeota bacterium]
MNGCARRRIAANRRRLAFVIGVTSAVVRWSDARGARLGPLGRIGALVARVLALAPVWLVATVWYLGIVLLWVACRPFDRGRRPAGPIEHVFVLMLENRSFDHLLGFSAISGTDAATGQPTRVDGAGPATENAWAGRTYPATEGADWVMPIDPGHEFADTLLELCHDPVANPAPKYPDAATGGYPPITNAGFVADYAGKRGDPAEVMRCYRPEQVPVLTALAREFAVCDRWFSSMPGPTWPNRFFAHAASSGGLDDSPSKLSSLAGVTIDGFKFDNGTIFDQLGAAGLDWAIYEGDLLPVSLAISGMNLAALDGRFVSYEHFREEVRRPDFSRAYSFIEPNYGHYLIGGHFKCGNSQHPLDDITRGERLIKDVYEAIRSSPHWERSLLIVTYDEHGGFYDHVPPPAAVPPGDSTTDPENNRHGFEFDQLGVRVPAVVVSPLVPRGTIDHRVCDHTSILRTIEDVFALEPLTQRDAVAASLLPLLSL